MSGWGEPWDLGGTRCAFPAPRLKDMGAAVAVVAFASTDWIAKTFRCSEAEAKAFKADAGHDFMTLMAAARSARGRVP
jgi:hypothetical protein